MTEIPVLDIGGFRADPTSGDGRAFVEQLRGACHGPGFAYLTGHGIDPALDSNLLASARSFFALPVEEREALAIVNSAAFRGYTVLGDERTAGAADWRDQLDVGPEQEAPPTSSRPHWRRLRGPNQWPTSIPTMQPTVLGWMAGLESLGLDALRALALGLGQTIDHFDAGFLPESDVHLKIIRYPARAPGMAVDQGVGRHHDSGLLTFILQDEIGGLQVEIDGEFVDAPPLEGAYIMNLGEMLQRATDGYLRATPHRVVSPSGAEDRISIAFFFNPRFEKSFQPVELPSRLKEQASGGDNTNPDDPVHTLFGENNLKIRLRSHPDVAQRHYSDFFS